MERSMWEITRTVQWLLIMSTSFVSTWVKAPATVCMEFSISTVQTNDRIELLFSKLFSHSQHIRSRSRYMKLLTDHQCVQSAAYKLSCKKACILMPPLNWEQAGSVIAIEAYLDTSSLLNTLHVLQPYTVGERAFSTSAPSLQTFQRSCFCLAAVSRPNLLFLQMLLCCQPRSLWD